MENQKRKQEVQINHSILLRCLKPEELPSADKLRQAAGWNQTPRDWQRFLSLDPDGCFAAIDGGEIVGTATTTSYGRDLAWIGMVLVDPARRNEGIGRKLLLHCLDYLQKKGVRCIKLDATPAGQILYEKLGFQIEFPLMRWERPGNAGALEAPPVPDEYVIASMQRGDWEEIFRLDREISGVDRGSLLAQLVHDSSDFLVCRGMDQAVQGVGLLRDGINAHYVGPVMARTEKTGVALLQKLLFSASNQRIFWDIPDPCVPAREWAKNHGFVPQRSLLRMFLGDNISPGFPQQQWAISDPATG
ncbi:GNAT family N-acetyltransferase [Methylacidiphilales bacterium]|nr:GNAT family N-acetyltransferase [Candidatus Methylacidiphilales bacterium]